MSAIVLCSVALIGLGQQPTKGYARPELLIEAADLAKAENTKKFRVLETRPAKEWTEAHIPFSVPVDVAEWSKKFAAGQDAKAWEKSLGLLGIDVDVPTVVTGDDLREVARVWWILHYWGIKDVRILNGGWAAWEAGKHPVDKGAYAQPHYQTTTPRLVPAEKRLATKDQVKDSLKDHLLQIIDARSEREFCGEMKMAKRGGAIPGAVNLEWKEVLDPRTKKFKSAGELEQIFKKAGIDLSKPAVAHCQSGGRSSVMVFAMELMGAADARNYYRSWAEWGNAEDTPVVVPKK